MTQTLLQFLLTIVMYSIMGLVVGVGVVLVKKYPKIGEFLTQHPILGWTLAFALGSVALTLTMGAFEALMLTILTTLMR